MPTLAVISLAAPAMMAGATLIALPVIAHMLNRRARREIVFPTVRFLLASSAMRSSVTKIRRWVLLTLRCLAVALLALAFARPTWFGGSEAESSDSGVAVVFILDESASTGQMDGGVSALSSLRGTALRTLDSLRPGADMVDLIEVGDAPKALFGRLSPNITGVKDAIEKATPGYGRADLASALARAGETLATHPGPKKLVLLSDLQATNWQELIDGMQTSGMAQALPEGTKVTIAAPEGTGTDNIAVASVRVAPTIATLGQPAEVIVLLRNFGGTTQRVPVTMTVDTDAGVSKTVELAPFSQVEASFDVTFEVGGEHRVMATLPDDRLAADNRGYAVARVIDRLPVLIVGDDDPKEPGSATFFLKRAMAPRGGVGDAYALAVVSSDTARAPAIREAAVVVLSDIDALSTESAGVLAEFVRRGGSLLVFCGDGPVADNLTKLDKAAGEGGMMPCRVASARILAPGEEAWTIGQGEWTDPMLRVFDERGRTALAAAHFRRTYPATEMADGATVLLSFADGSAALSSRRVGSGSVVLAHFSPAAANTDLARTGTFVALVHSVLDGLPSRRTARPSITVGQTMARRFGIPGSTPDIHVLDPSGKPIQADITPSPDSVEIVTERLTQPGPYRFMSGDATFGWDVVNMDSRESDLRRSDAEGVRASLEKANVTTAVASNDVGTPLIDVTGRPLWHLVILLASAALGVEMLLLGVWKR